MNSIGWLRTIRTERIDPTTGEPLYDSDKKIEASRMATDYGLVMEERAARVREAMQDAVVLRPGKPPQSDDEFVATARGYLYCDQPYRAMALAPMYPTSAYGVAQSWPDGSVDLSDPNPTGLINYRPSKAAYAQLRQMLTSEPAPAPTGVFTHMPGAEEFGAAGPPQKLDIVPLVIDAAQAVPAGQARSLGKPRLVLRIGPGNVSRVDTPRTTIEVLQGRVGRVLVPVEVADLGQEWAVTVYEAVDDGIGLRHMCEVVAEKVAQARKAAHIKSVNADRAAMGYEALTPSLAQDALRSLAHEIASEMYELAVRNLAYTIGIFQPTLSAQKVSSIALVEPRAVRHYTALEGCYTTQAPSTVQLQLGMLWQGADHDIIAAVPPIRVTAAWEPVIRTLTGLRPALQVYEEGLELALPEKFADMSAQDQADFRRRTYGGHLGDVFIVGTRHKWMGRALRAKAAFDMCDASGHKHTAMVEGTLHPKSLELVLEPEPTREHMESGQAYAQRLQAWEAQCEEARTWHKRTCALKDATRHLPLDREALCCFVHFQRPLVDESGQPLPGTEHGGLALSIHCRGEVHAGTLYGVDPEQEAVSGRAMKTDLAALCECLR